MNSSQAELEKAKSFYADYYRIIQLLIRTRDLRASSMNAISHTYYQISECQTVVRPFLDKPREDWPVAVKQTYNQIAELESEIANLSKPLANANKHENKIHRIIEANLAQALRDVIEIKQHTTDPVTDDLLSHFRKVAAKYEECLPELSARLLAEQRFLAKLDYDSFKTLNQLYFTEEKLANEFSADALSMLHYFEVRRDPNFVTRVRRILTGTGGLALSGYIGFQGLMNLWIGADINHDGDSFNDTIAHDYMFKGFILCAIAGFILLGTGILLVKPAPEESQPERDIVAFSHAMNQKEALERRLGQ